MNMNRKIRKIDIKKGQTIIKEMKKNLEDYFNQIKYEIDYDEEEYHINKKCYDVLLKYESLEDWEKNIFIARYINNAYGKDVSIAMNISSHTLYQYTSNIKQKLK